MFEAVNLCPVGVGRYRIQKSPGAKAETQSGAGSPEAGSREIRLPLTICIIIYVSESADRSAAWRPSIEEINFDFY